jgi:hypothetical protein
VVNGGLTAFQAPLLCVAHRGNTMKVAKLLTTAMISATILAGAYAAPAHAATVYNNGVPDHNDGYNYSGASTSADDFRLTSAATITGASFYALSQGAVTSLTYYIYAAGLVGPGTQLATGAAQGLTYAPTGSAYFGLTEALVSFNFASAFNAAANTTYWLGLNTGSTLSYWETAAANTTSVAYQNNNGAGFNATPVQLSFTLVSNATGAVPEPATWAMMILGMGAVGFAMRRKSNVTTNVAFARA